MDFDVSSGLVDGFMDLRLQDTYVPVGLKPYRVGNGDHLVSDSAFPHSPRSPQSVQLLSHLFTRSPLFLLRFAALDYQAAVKNVVVTKRLPQRTPERLGTIDR